MNNSPIEFFFAYLGRYLAPDASPEASANISLPTRTKASRSAGLSGADLPRMKLGAGMPVYYIVTTEHSWFLSNTAATSTPEVTAIRIDDDDGKAAIKGNQYIAHWLANDAPADSPFLIGNMEKANPVPAMTLSLPPTRVVFSSTGKNAGLALNLADYRDDIATISANGIPWAVLKKSTLLKEQVRLSAKGILAPEIEGRSREELGKLRKKHPELMATLKLLHFCSGSGDESMLHWYFTDGNVYGQPPREVA